MDIYSLEVKQMYVGITVKQLLKLKEKTST